MSGRVQATGGIQWDDTGTTALPAPTLFNYGCSNVVSGSFLDFQIRARCCDGLVIEVWLVGLLLRPDAAWHHIVSRRISSGPLSAADGLHHPGQRAPTS
jgi:hypothetical protein